MTIGRAAQLRDNAKIWVLIKNMRHKINKTETDSDTENTLMIARGGGGWRAT